MIDVTLDGKTYQEMHVDGGAVAQTFLYPSALTRNRAQRRRAGQPVVEARAFIIRNGRLDPEWATVERRTLGIAGRAISTMIASAGYNDVIRIYTITQRDDIDYNLAFIGTDFNEVLPSPFDRSLHARPVRLRLPAGAARLRLGKEAADHLILQRSSPPPRSLTLAFAGIFSTATIGA